MGFIYRILSSSFLYVQERLHQLLSPTTFYLLHCPTTLHFEVYKISVPIFLVSRFLSHRIKCSKFLLSSVFILLVKNGTFLLNASMTMTILFLISLVQYPTLLNILPSVLNDRFLVILYYTLQFAMMHFSWKPLLIFICRRSFSSFVLFNSSYFIYLFKFFFQHCPEEHLICSKYIQ